jgi:hypothetical protein
LAKNTENSYHNIDPRYSRGCRACDDALLELETIDDDAEKFNVEFVKINDKVGSPEWTQNGGGGYTYKLTTKYI